MPHTRDAGALEPVLKNTSTCEAQSSLGKNGFQSILFAKQVCLTSTGDIDPDTDAELDELAERDSTVATGVNALGVELNATFGSDDSRVEVVSVAIRFRAPRPAEGTIEQNNTNLTTFGFIKCGQDNDAMSYLRRTRLRDNQELGEED